MLSTEQQKIVSHFKGAFASNSLRHAYIISGAHGVGKKRAADELQLLFACQKGVGCGQCQGCKSARAGANSDIIRLSLGDKKVYEIARIRELIKKIHERPSGQYKLIIIEDAQSLGEICQNALLKAIEEPPEYAVFVLLCDNILSILPTVLSRVMVIEMQPWKRSELEALCPLDDVKSYLYDIAQGNPGSLLAIASDEEFSAVRDSAIGSFVKLVSSSDYGVYDASECWLDRKECIKEMLGTLTLFLRDVLFVAQGRTDAVINKDKLKEAQSIAARISPKAALEITELAGSAAGRMGRNENLAMAVQAMFMKIKEIIR